MTFLQIKTGVRRLIYRLLRTHRPSSYPFISGDSFRAMSQHICDEHFNINPERVEKNDIVFVRGNFLIDFFKNVHPKIEYPYILISHNDDTNIDEYFSKYIDEKILHWFAQSVTFKHPQLTALPAGISNLYHNNIGQLRYFDQKNIKKEGKTLIRYNFSIKSSAERIDAKKNLDKNPLSKKIEVKNQDEYIELIKKSYYVASPSGAGVDSHRTWEAMYLRTIPIVIKNPMNKHFKDIGLPMLMINSWDDIHNFTEDFLKKEYDNIFNKDYFPQVFMDYWQREIIKYKK